MKPYQVAVAMKLFYKSELGKDLDIRTESLALEIYAHAIFSTMECSQLIQITLIVVNLDTIGIDLYGIHGLQILHKDFVNNYKPNFYEKNNYIFIDNVFASCL